MLSTLDRQALHYIFVSESQKFPKSSFDRRFLASFLGRGLSSPRVIPHEITQPPPRPSGLRGFRSFQTAEGHGMCSAVNVRLENLKRLPWRRIPHSVLLISGSSTRCFSTKQCMYVFGVVWGMFLEQIGNTLQLRNTLLNLAAESPVKPASLNFLDYASRATLDVIGAAGIYSFSVLLRCI